jgi:UDP:flavonoid glycosyltransferase YjiC (YdhE family)
MRVALVSGPDPGHLIPIAALAVRLRDAGHSPLVVTGRRWQQTLERDGVAFDELPLLAAVGPDDGFGARLSGRAATMAGPLAHALRGYGPHVVVGDTLTRAGGLAAGALGVPWVELIPHNLADASVVLPPFGTGWDPKPLRDRVLRALAARSRRRGELEQARAAWAAGLAAPAPAYRLVATLPGLEPARPDWPARTAVVGPLAWDPIETDLVVPAGAGPLILVVGSTASGGGRDLLNDCVDVLVGDDVRLVSPRLDPRPDVLPDRVSAGRGRLRPLLAAADVVVSTGGHGLVVAALTSGVPLVLLPGSGDQKEVSARVARAGAAIIATPNTLRESIFRVLSEPAYARRAGELGSSGALPDPVALVESVSVHPC